MSEKKLSCNFSAWFGVEMSTKMNATELKILSELAAIRDQLTAMGSSSTSMKKTRARKPKDPDAPPRPPNAWIVFTGRVRSVLKAANLGAGKECQQFASHLKASNPDAYNMTDSQILKARNGWTAPPPKPKEVVEDTSAPAASDDVPKPKPKRTLSDEQKAKMAAGRKAAAERKKAEAAATEVVEAPAPAPAPAAPKTEAPKSDKKLRALPFKGKRYLWDQETNGLWAMESDGSKGSWVGVLAADRKSINTQAPNPDGADGDGDE